MKTCLLWLRRPAPFFAALSVRPLVALILGFAVSLSSRAGGVTDGDDNKNSLLNANNPTGSVHPFDAQMDEDLAQLASSDPTVAAGAAERLGFLRAYRAEPALLAKLRSSGTEVARQAALALAWCGGRTAIPALIEALDHADWFTRQAAHVALTNLTGMEFPFNALAPTPRRSSEAKLWREWWATVPPDHPPKELLALLAGPRALMARNVTVSSAYKGPADVLIDGEFGPGFWQTKQVKPPQWCVIDLGREAELEQVTVHQYGPGYCMTEYELALSSNGEIFTPVRREKGLTPVELIIAFAPQRARYVRITSFGAQNPKYPTTFYEIEVREREAPASALPANEPIAWRQERGARALGVLGGKGTSEALIDFLGKSPTSASAHRPAVRAAIRSLGRLREKTGFEYLVRLLENPMWARAAADALGEVGDRLAVPPLLKAYERYAKRLDGKDPPEVPADDKMTFPSEDRMLETPYWIAYALCRLPLDDPHDREELRRLAPLVMANLPGDHDTFILYQPEVGHLITRHLLDQAGLRQEACEHALVSLGQPRRGATSAETRAWPIFPHRRMATWLPAICTEKEDLPRLVALLEDSEHWVRLNAAKALGLLGDRRAVEPLARLLAEAKPEADFGYSGTFKDEEYNDPAPRWREGLIRALGLLGAVEHTALITRILNDERSVLEVRRAAAEALVDLGGTEAIGALQRAAADHDFFNIRRVAEDALRSKGVPLPGPRISPSEVFLPNQGQGHPDALCSVETRAVHGPVPSFSFDTLVFIKGDNDVPNTPQTVEQADRWRQTYVVTDEGPTYRPGNNLYLLRPPGPAGTVTPLTTFAEGYVAEPEVSWDGSQVVFCHRGRNDPWWQVYTIGVDGRGLKQLTKGPYHSVGPVWLPDGRIVFASSRLGARDEYHGYLCTALCVMNADGSGLQQLAANIGRDNEPAVLMDGRIVFSRLEVFYSRNKTELTLHAMHPDGRQDVVLYGPERRQFWRDLKHGAPDPADGQEAPLTHRVLRMTQPQPMPDGRHIIVSTQGGLTLVGPSRDTETLLCPDYQDYAYTTPFPLPDGRVLCSVTAKTPNRKEVDLGIYRFNPATGQRELVYNDPATADYEARPIMARAKPVALVEHPSREPSGRFLCASVFNTQEPDVRLRGRLVRVIEGVPQVARHATQTTPDEVWKNHGGTLARVLGTAPLAADGSFFLEVPADRLLHIQVLDSDRRVIGNQLTWNSPRPGETKSCIGCHEGPNSTTHPQAGLAAHLQPLDFLPRGDEFAYRAKAWFKGSLPAEIEERTRTVHAVNLLGR